MSILSLIGRDSELFRSDMDDIDINIREIVAN